MSVFITFVAALLIFGAVIAIHEFGHFAVAKLCGVQVNEFSIGMGPTLIKTYRKGTQYTLRLLPVGGFVALEGEESPESEQAEGGSGDDDGPDIPPEVLAQRTGKPLNEAAVWQRMLVMAAGAVMNFVLGFVVLLLLISLRSEPITSKVIYAVEDNALCGQTGLQAGDEIVAVNGGTASWPTICSTSSCAPRATAQTSPSAGTAGSWSCRTSSSTPGRMSRARPT